MTLTRTVDKYLKYIFFLIFFPLFLKHLNDNYVTNESPNTSLTNENVSSKNGVINTAKFGKKKPWKTIVAWTDYFKSRDVWRVLFRRLINEECEESRCRFSINQNDLPKADAVLFNSFNMRFEDLKDVKSYSIPMMRNDGQIFVYYSTEPPTRIDQKYLKKIRYHFNWTMSYRSDSDIVMPFGRVIKRMKKGKIRKVTNEVLKNRKMLIWIASHCFKTRQLLRDIFVQELTQYLPVDIFGKCGKRCDSLRGVNQTGTEVGEASCEKKIKDYSFYLALENSLCKEYITEKVFKAWKMGVIPVVFGAGNYSAIAPPNSYIDARKFDSVKSLATYLTHVASNASLYNSYLYWEENYHIEMGCPYKCFVCDLCKKLHNFPKNGANNLDVYDWFVTNSSCQYDHEH